MTIDIEHMGVHILNESDVCAMIEQNAALAAALLTVEGILVVHDTEKDKQIAELATALADRGHSEACLPGRCHCVKGRVSEILAAHDASVCRPLLEALRKIHANCVAGSADPRLGVARSSIIRIGEISDEILSRYTDDGREK